MFCSQGLSFKNLKNLGDDNDGTQGLISNDELDQDAQEEGLVISPDAHGSNGAANGAAASGTGAAPAGGHGHDDDEEVSTVLLLL